MQCQPMHAQVKTLVYNYIIYIYHRHKTSGVFSNHIVKRNSTLGQTGGYLFSTLILEKIRLNTSQQGAQQQLTQVPKVFWQRLK